MPPRAIVMVVLSALNVLAQTGAQRSGIYQDDEVRTKILEGWHLANSPHPAVEPYRLDGRLVVGSSVAQAKRSVLLQKRGYTLALAYDTQHAGPGRFIEAFRIPWLNADNAWACSNFFQPIPQPANTKLLFINLVLRTGDAQLDKTCGIPKGFGLSVVRNKRENFGPDRWFAGYFTTDGASSDGYFFASQGSGCGVKTYSLTTNATSPSQLPPPDDPELRTIVKEAIEMVNSIDYKQCAPVANE